MVQMAQQWCLSKTAAYGKPHFIGEFGLPDPTTECNEDCQGVNILNGITAPVRGPAHAKRCTDPARVSQAFVQCAGQSMTWWCAEWAPSSLARSMSTPPFPLPIPLAPSALPQVGQFR